MSIDVDQLLEDVAARHRIIVRRDDPIVATIALHEAILDDHAKRVEASVQALVDHAQALADRQAARAKDLATTVVGDALIEAQRTIREEARAARSGLKASQPGVRPHGGLMTALWASWGVSALCLIALTALLLREAGLA